MSLFAHAYPHTGLHNTILLFLIGMLCRIEHFNHEKVCSRIVSKKWKSSPKNDPIDHFEILSEEIVIYEYLKNIKFRSIFFM